MSKLTVPPDIIGTNQPDVVQGADRYIGIEILTNGVIDTLLGDDTIAGEGLGFFTGIGISNSGTINTGLGNDTITGNGVGGGIFRNSTPGLGIDNRITGIINAGSGNDLIKGTGTGQTGRGISNEGKISAGLGDDDIIGISTGDGAGGDAIGILNSGSISGGKGNDSLIGTGTGNRNIYGTGGEGIGISNTGTIDGDAGTDNIIGAGTGGFGRVYDDGPGFGGQGIGILNTSSINSGKGDNLITGIGRGGEGFLDRGGHGTGISNSSDIYTANGSDTITGIGIGGLGNSAPDGRGVGIFNTGRIYAGCGKDKIFGYGTSVGIEGNDLELIGIDGGLGNDYFKARKISGLDAEDNPIESTNQDGAVANIFISGGKGKDIFDLGFGTAKLDGGHGCDTLILPVLGSGTYTIGKPDVNGWFEITNTSSANIFSVSSIEHIVSGGVTLV